VPPAQRPELAAALERLGFDHSPVGDGPVTRFLINDRR
jgi:hypothetical protein